MQHYLHVFAHTIVCLWSNTFIFTYIPMLNKHALTQFNCFVAFNIYSERITYWRFPRTENRFGRGELCGQACARGKEQVELEHEDAKDESWNLDGSGREGLYYFFPNSGHWPHDVMSIGKYV